MKWDTAMFCPNSGAFRTPDGRFVAATAERLRALGFAPEGDHLVGVDADRSQTWRRIDKKETAA